MRFISKYLVLALAFCLFFSTNAEARNIRGVLNLGLDFGGDTLVDGSFVGGDTFDIKAGELLYFSGGIIFMPDSIESNFETHLTIGWKFDSVNADNGDIDFNRFPLELLYFYKVNNWRLGGGLTYHLNPKLKGSGVASGINANFDDALGFVIQSHYSLDETFSIGVRYTIIDYEGEGLKTIDANSFGLTLGYSF